ncbi:hypothetical protein [Tabrizicola sp.]|uniref:hypothetical protein n=1 Tax=Tabrizicola sp. TaxID=2005166 RepID=UPI002612E62A|nr:hypothetical protein [Tabrizicola sp.]MDM7930961.1 hypothetical protein [Tabrizicola sp.]
MRASMVAVTLSVLALGACASDPGPVEPYAFVGIWDCGVATFVFTNTSYNNGSTTIPIRTATQSGRNFMLYLEGGSKVALGAVTATGLTWVSSATGDQLNCRRVN